ncbi:MAG: histidine kinase dimerization/phospho-acceptor domain-containing protein [Paenacidovorax caeni]
MRCARRTTGAAARHVSHDLRAPLRHITSFAPLLRGSVRALPRGHAKADAEAEQFLSTMEQAARRMVSMVDALLLLSRVQRGTAEPRPDRPCRAGT